MNERFRDLLRALALGTMAGCVGFAVGQLGHFFFVGWSVTYFTLVATLAAIEAYYSWRVSQQQSLYQIEKWRFRAIELAVLFVLVKLGGTIGRPWSAVLADVAVWPSDPMRVLDPQTIVAVLLAFFSWLLALQTAQDLQQLDEPGEYHLREGPPIERLRGRFLGVGVSLLTLTGLARVGFAALLNMARPPVPGLVLNILLYFALGLVMLGQAWFATLSQGWRMQSIDVASGLAQRWVWYTVLLCLLAGALAALLPTRYTIATFGVVLVVLEAFFSGLQFIFALLMFLFALVLWFVSHLLHLSNEPRPAAPAPPSFPVTPERQVPAVSWFVVLRNVFFWVVLVAVLFYLVRGYLRDHPEIGRALASLAPLRWLHALWRWLRGCVDAWAHVASKRLFHRPLRQAGEGATTRGPRLGRLVLSLRERIEYTYLQVLRRAARQGFPRLISETPGEYRQALGPQLAGAQPELEQLTAAFVEARYSEHPVKPAGVARVRRLGQQIRRALRGLQLRRAEEATKAAATKEGHGRRGH